MKLMLGAALAATLIAGPALADRGGSDPRDNAIIRQQTLEIARGSQRGWAGTVRRSDDAGQSRAAAPPDRYRVDGSR